MLDAERRRRRRLFAVRGTVNPFRGVMRPRRLGLSGRAAFRTSGLRRGARRERARLNGEGNCHATAYSADYLQGRAGEY